MIERGSLASDGPLACPFVAFEEDRDLRATAPDRRHRCYAEPQPAPRAMAHQEHYCLAPSFPACPTFVDWARREAARPAERMRTSPAGAAYQEARAGPADWYSTGGAGGVVGGQPHAAPGAPGAGPPDAASRPQPREAPRLRDEPRDPGLWGSDDVAPTRRRNWAAPPPWLARDIVEDEDGAVDEPEEDDDARPGPEVRDAARQPAGSHAAGEASEADAAEFEDWQPARRPPRDPDAGPGPAAGWSRDAASGGELARVLESVAAPGDLSAVRERPPGGVRDRAGEGEPSALRGAGASAPPGDRAASPAGGTAPSAAPGRARSVTPSPARPAGRSGAGPALSQARPALGGRARHDPGAPSWERPRRLEAYPHLRTRVGLPNVPRLALYGVALVVAAIVLFLAPTFLSGGGGPAATASPTAGANGTTRPSSAPRTPAVPTPLVYTVVDGDTLSGIAARYGLTVDALVKANPQVKNPDQLGIGDELTIPARPPSTPVPVGPSTPNPSGSAAP